MLIILEVLSQLCGYTQMFFWVFGMVVIPYECIKIKSSRGLSKDFMMNQLVGFSLMAFQDMFGFFYPWASYHSEVHISDLILSGCGTIFGYFGTLIVFMIPSDVPNDFSLVSKVINSAAVL